LDPPRLAAAPGITLDVVIRSQSNSSSTSTISTSSTEPLLKTPPNTLQHANSALNTTRRSPAGGLEEQAMENYTHIDVSTVTSTKSTIAAEQNSTNSFIGLMMGNTKKALAPFDQFRRAPQLIVNEQVSDGYDYSIDIQGQVSSIGASYPKELVDTMMKAESGIVAARVALAEMYLHGCGIRKDSQKAIDWYLKATDDSDQRAHQTLENICSSATGMTEICITAINRYRPAANHGDLVAQRNIGCLYYYGQDYSQSMFWLLKAAEKGDPIAQVSVGFMIRCGHGVSADASKAVFWYQKAADQGSAAGQVSLGLLYVNGQGVAQDSNKAMSLFQMAADQDYVDAQVNIAIMYHHGMGIPQDYIKARSWYLKAAKQDDPRA
ncbi:hypothetical protein FBU30_001814, partial [Linnemannia zychae]